MNPLAKKTDPIRIVLDTSVLVAAARSRSGASYAIVSSIPDPRFRICLSVGLYLEWQEVLTRPENLPSGMNERDVIGFLRFLAAQAQLQDIHFLWRPYLADPDDDMVLELAVAAGCPYILTHNVSDFRPAADFGISARTPGEFLAILRSLS